MKKIKSIQLKAAFLLIVFSLNTIIGFACAVGFDMSFNSNHHEEEVAKTTEHVHDDGKKHLHNNAIDHHDENVKVHHETSAKDNCCNDEVTKIIQQDKAVAPSVNIVSPVFFTALISSFYSVDALFFNGADSHIKYLVTL